MIEININESQHSYSSVQLNLPLDIAEEIMRWSKKTVPNSKLYIDTEDHTYGRENNPHVTILHGFHTNNPNEIEKFLQNEKRFEVYLDKINIFDNNEKYDVLKIDVKSTDIMMLNRKLANSFEHTTRFSYHPHSTIAYVLKGTCDELKGNNHFVGKKIEIKEVIFSDKDRKQTKIKLKQA